MKKINLKILIICLFFSTACAYAFELTGRVYENTKKEGIPGLVIKIKPPKALKQPEKITKTDKDGEFIIKDLDKNKYLLEVFEGTTIIHREVLEINEDTTKVIELEKSE